MEFARNRDQQERVENQVVKVKNPGGEGERDDSLNSTGLALVHHQFARIARNGRLGRLYIGDWLHGIGYGWLFLPVATVKGTRPAARHFDFAKAPRRAFAVRRSECSEGFFDGLFER